MFPRLFVAVMLLIIMHSQCFGGESNHRGQKQKSRMQTLITAAEEVLYELSEPEEKIEASCFDGFISEDVGLGFESYSCQLCNSACFRTVSCFWEHLLAKHKDMSVILPCPYKNCWRIGAYSYKDIISHINDEHGSHCYPCSCCSETFSSIEPYADHLAESHGKRPWLCSTCSLAFLDPQNFIKHRQSKCCEIEKGQIFICLHCWRSFSDDTALQEHKNTSDIHKFFCRGCNKKYATQYEFDNHPDCISAARIEELFAT